MTPRTATIAGVGAVVVVVGAATATRPASSSPATSRAGQVRPVTQGQLVCPGLDGGAKAPVQISVADATRMLTPQSPAMPHVTVAPLRGALTGATSLVLTPASVSPTPGATVTATRALPATVVSSSGAGASNVTATQRSLVPEGTQRGLLTAPCLPAVTDTWITGADGRVGRSDVLVLANPGSTDAALAVSAWSATGRVDLPDLDSYSLAAGHSVALDVADYAPDAALVTLHVHAAAGRVAAQVRDSQVNGLSAAGTDWLPPTLPPAHHLVVAGFVAGAGPRELVVTNPGRNDATVQLRLIAPDRAFVPSGHPQLVVPPGRSALLDLSTSLGGVAAAAELTSDQSVVASGLSIATSAGGQPDVAWQPATDALDGPAVLAANSSALGAGGVLALTTVGGAATVQLVAGTGRQITVAVDPDRTTTVDLIKRLGADATGPIAVVPMSGAVWASYSLAATGAHGPLLTAVAPWPLPPPLRLPRVKDDLRVAVR